MTAMKNLIADPNKTTTRPGSNFWHDNSTSKAWKRQFQNRQPLHLYTTYNNSKMHPANWSVLNPPIYWPHQASYGHWPNYLKVSKMQLGSVHGKYFPLSADHPLHPQAVYCAFCAQAIDASKYNGHLTAQQLKNHQTDFVCTTCIGRWEQHIQSEVNSIFMHCLFN